MAVYMETARGVESALNASKRKRRFKLDQDRLTIVVDEVLKRYDLDPSLLGSNNKYESNLQSIPTRCKYA